jgi:pilus assembly protein CpaF
MTGLGISIRHDGGAARYCEIDAFPCSIGRASSSQIQLSGWRIGREHAQLERVGDGFKWIDRGSLTGSRINGQRVTEFGPLNESDVIEVGDYQLQVVILHAPTPDQTSEIHGAAETGLKPLEASYARASSHEQVDVNALHEDRLVQRLHRELLQKMDLRHSSVQHYTPAQLRAETARHLDTLMEQSGLQASARVHQRVLDEAVGLGPLEELLADPEVSEIMVNRYDQMFVERGGRLAKCASKFSSEQALRAIIERIVSPLGRRVDEASPMVDARLADGSRINVIVPPLALRGTALTIRRFNRAFFLPTQLVESETCSAEMMRYLEHVVHARSSVLVSGGTGSGKTTMLNLLAQFIDPAERVVSIEDAAELQLGLSNWIPLECRPPNSESQGEVTVRTLVRNALRMRPDRLLVGECRGAEAVDMLQAMNTGHSGSMTTLHANSARDSLARLETMSLMANLELPIQAIREQIASAIGVVVQMQRLRSGRRVMSEVVEITGLEGSRIQLQPMFAWDNTKQQFQATGLPSRVIDTASSATQEAWR